MSQNEDFRWYALYTRPRHEKKVDAGLQEKGIETYLPMKKVLKQWSDRRKWVEEPLFRSYIFVHANPAVRYQAVQTRGVVRMVMFRGEPAVVRDAEIDMIRRVLREKQDVEVTASRFREGDPVRVIMGPLTGLEGRVISMQGENRLILDVPSIQQSIRFSVHAAELESVGSSGA